MKLYCKLKVNNSSLNIDCLDYEIIYRKYSKLNPIYHTITLMFINFNYDINNAKNKLTYLCNLSDEELRDMVVAKITEDLDKKSETSLFRKKYQKQIVKLNSKKITIELDKNKMESC